MMGEKINSVDKTSVAVSKLDGLAEGVKLSGHYEVRCFDKDGNLKWEDTIKNLVTNVGGANLLDNHLSGSTYTAAWYLGLVDGGSAPTYALADTAASHAGWTENTNYTAGSRPAVSFNAASGKSKSSNEVVFTMNATGTIAGAFLISNNTKSGTTGVLFSCGNFSGGNRAVVNTDELRIVYTATA